VRGIFRIKPDRVVLLAAVAAEVSWIQEYHLVLPSRGEPLRIERHQSLALGLQRTEYLARATDELVKLEGEQGPLIARLDLLRGGQETGERVLRLTALDACIVAEQLGGVSQR